MGTRDDSRNWKCSEDPDERNLDSAWPDGAAAYCNDRTDGSSPMADQ